MSRPLSLRLLPERFAVARLDPESPVPDWVGGEVSCVARTPAELSIVCDQTRVPDSIRANRPWGCFEVAGPLDFSEIGILAALTEVLGAAGVSVFVFSTFDTDYLLVRAERLADAVGALEAAGHTVVGAEPSA